MAKPTRLTQDMIDDYIDRGYWDELSISDILRRNAERYPDKEAAVDSETRLTWAELEERANRIAVGLLKSGMKRDQAMIAQLPSSATSLLLLLACHRAGILCCFSPMTFRYNELRHIAQTVKAVAVVTPWRYRGVDYFTMAREIAREVPELTLFLVTDEDVPQGARSFRSVCETPFERGIHEASLRGMAFRPFEVSAFVLSSGTTGMPKCIEHTGASFKSAGWGVVQRAKLTEDDVIGNIAPFSGGPGLQNWWSAFQAGAKTCLLEHFSPDRALELIQGEGITYLSVIPTQLIRMLKECDLDRYDLGTLRVIRTGAAALDASLARETEQRFNCKVLIAGGSQETFSFAQSGVDDPREKRLSTLGRPFPGNEIKIVDDHGREAPAGQTGQLLARGAATSSGYYGDLDATLEAWGTIGNEGWFNTGDLARVDEQGYLTLVGRKKEMILRGGQNIYPREIEDLLLSHPTVRQALIIGIPDPVMGERVCACVTPVVGNVISFEDMTAFLREKGLAVHKLPERLMVMEHLPQLADGQKVDKITLRNMILEKLSTETH
jgi:cyclohexanecarboxylate-CoA ligase